MSKNSPEAKESYRATDGKIPAADLSETLVGGSSGGDGMGVGEPPEDLLFVVIDLADVNLEVFDSLREGMAVVLVPGRRIAVYVEKGGLVGYVRSADKGRVSNLLAQNTSAWISSLYHKGVMVKIEVDHGV